MVVVGEPLIPIESCFYNEKVVNEISQIAEFASCSIFPFKMMSAVIFTSKQGKLVKCSTSLFRYHLHTVFVAS